MSITRFSLTGKVAVVTGSGRGLGEGIAKGIAGAGAAVVTTARTASEAENTAKEIVAAGGSAEAAEIDALDEQAIDTHLRSVVDTAGRVDISFNAVGFPDETILGVPLIDLDVERFAEPIADYTTSYFLTARLAARRMVPNGSGVIMTVTSLPARMGSRLNGGYGSAHAAKEALTRDLSAELAADGIRVVGLRPHGMPETKTMREVFDAKATALGVSWEQFQGYLAGSTHPRRVMTLDEVAGVAAFVASDRASGLTGTTVNLTMGGLDD